MFIFYCLPFLWDTRDCSKGPGEGVSGGCSLVFGLYSCHLLCGSSAEWHQYRDLNCFLILMIKIHTLPGLPHPRPLYAFPGESQACCWCSSPRTSCLGNDDYLVILRLDCHRSQYPEATLGPVLARLTVVTPNLCFVDPGKLNYFCALGVNLWGIW